MAEREAGPVGPEVGDEGLPGDLEESDVAGTGVEERRDVAAEKAAGAEVPEGEQLPTEEFIDEIGGREGGRTAHTDWPGD